MVAIESNHETSTFSNVKKTISMGIRSPTADRTQSELGNSYRNGRAVEVGRRNQWIFASVFLYDYDTVQILYVSPSMNFCEKGIFTGRG